MVKTIQKKHIAIEQANKMLPAIEKVVWKMVKINNSLATLTSVDVEFEEDYEELCYDVQFNKKFHELSSEFYNHYQSLLELGAIVTDVDMGLVDFFCKHKDQEILLCWQLGEKSIQFWHDVDKGFKSRKHIDELEKVKVE
jgi:hypothetical protein